MSKARIQREQKIAEAEGFLDLIIAGGENCALSELLKEDLASYALDSLNSLDETAGRRGHVLYLRGVAHRLCQRYENAVEALEESLDFDSNEIQVYLSLGWCYKRVGNIAAAITTLEDALNVDPTSGVVNYNLACYWALANNPLSSVKFLSRAFELDGRFRDLIGDEADFDSIRDHSAFLAVTTVIV